MIQQPHKLTPKQILFIDQYLIDLNATQAAIRAGYSSRRADAIGYENLRKPEIALAIQAAMEARQARTHITADGVLAGLEAVKSDAMRPKDGGGMVNPQAALKALELQGKHLGLWRERVEVTGKDGGPITSLIVTYV